MPWLITGPSAADYSLFACRAPGGENHIKPAGSQLRRLSEGAYIWSIPIIAFGFETPFILSNAGKKVNPVLVFAAFGNETKKKFQKMTKRACKIVRNLLKYYSLPMLM